MLWTQFSDIAFAIAISVCERAIKGFRKIVDLDSEYYGRLLLGKTKHFIDLIINFNLIYQLVNYVFNICLQLSIVKQSNVNTCRSSIVSTKQM